MYCWQLCTALFLNDVIHRTLHCIKHTITHCSLHCTARDAGMATPDHTPEGRGYDTSLGYFHHANDYWTEHVGEFVDMWETDSPANELNGTKDGSSGTSGTVRDYEEFKFLTFVLNTISEHDPSIPLFYNYDFHIVHEPLEVPAVYHEKFDFMATSEAGDFQGHRHVV